MVLNPHKSDVPLCVKKIEQGGMGDPCLEPRAGRNAPAVGSKILKKRL